MAASRPHIVDLYESITRGKLTQATAIWEGNQALHESIRQFSPDTSLALLQNIYIHADVSFFKKYIAILNQEIINMMIQAMQSNPAHYSPKHRNYQEKLSALFELTASRKPQLSSAFLLFGEQPQPRATVTVDTPIIEQETDVDTNSPFHRLQRWNF